MVGCLPADLCNPQSVSEIKTWQQAQDIKAWIRCKTGFYVIISLLL
jgi:hypothetical protein